MPGPHEGGDYPSARQAAELERLSKQLDDLRRSSGRRPAGRPEAAGSGAPIGLDSARQARRGESPSSSAGPSTGDGRRANRGSSGNGPTRRSGPPRADGELAAILPFRRAGADDDNPDEGSPRSGGRGRPAPDREARKAAARVAAAEAFAAQLEADPEEAARQLCLGWLAVRPHTRAELAAKLRRKGVPGEAMSSVLDRYGEVGLIDDAAFANAWVDSRHAGRGLAKRALAYELRSRGVDGDTIDAAVDRLDTSAEEATARALASRKLAGMGHVPPEARARRLMGMLARKGYPGGMAASVVREVIAGSGVHIPDPDLG